VGVVALIATLFVAAGASLQTRADLGVDVAVFEEVENQPPLERPDTVEMDTPRITFGAEDHAHEGVDPPPGPRIALVFDDLGYRTDGLAGELLELPAKLTFAILPGLRASRAFAESASVRGHEVILHLPLEPVDLDRHDPGHDALFVDLDPEENRRRLSELLEALPSYLGISNHMGSRFSSDPGSVELLLREVRRHDRSLFFLDSRTTPYSVIPEQAREVGVPCLSSNLFLDGTDPKRVRPPVQTRRLRRIADRRGQAIGIGHVRHETVEAVREAIPRWQADGIRLVGLSDLMHLDPRAAPSGGSSP
jgi:polysaccharide deacetylase 2 family uncharacterized protein YibQ